MLPGEHPAPLPTLSAGTYPDWSEGTIYVAGQRVLLRRRRLPGEVVDSGSAAGANPLQPSDTPWQLINARNRSGSQTNESSQLKARSAQVRPPSVE